MAARSVFVDDAVRGVFPMVCATSGQPADYLVCTTRAVGGGRNGAALLLVFLGPPGWLAFLLLSAFSSGQEQLTVRIPRTEVSFEWERQMRRFTWAAGLAGAASLGVALLQAGHRPLEWLALGVVFLVAAGALQAKLYLNDIGIRLDASRRWVTFTGVHPAFVRAVELQEAGLHRS